MAYQTINLAALPAPSALPVWSFDAIRDATLADAARRLTDAGIPYNVETLKGNPMNFIGSAYAYREGLVLQRINDAVNSTFLATADQFADVVLRAADVNVTPVAGENIESLRRRTQLRWEALSTGGTYGRYMSQAFDADPVNLADVAVYGGEISTIPRGQVWIVCLGANATGIPTPDTLQRVYDANAPRGVRVVNDQVVAKPANPVNYSVDATLILEDGADPAAVVTAQKALLASFAQKRRTIGATVSPDNIGAVLGYNAAGLVYDVVVRAPAAPIGGGPFDAPILTGARVVWQRRSA